MYGVFHVRRGTLRKSMQRGGVQRAIRPAIEALEKRALLSADIDVRSRMFEALDTGDDELPPGLTVTFDETAISDGDISPSESEGTDFGTAVAGDTGPTHTFTLTNTGSVPVVIEDPTLPEGFTLIQPLPDGPIEPGEKAEVIVRLLTDAVGTMTGEISFPTDIPEFNPFNFSIEGMITEPVVSPPPPSTAPEIAVTLDGGPLTDGQAQGIDFGTAIVGQAGVSRTFTVKNEGAATLVLLAVRAPEGFQVTEPLMGNLAPGASDTFTVTLATAGATGPKAGSLTIRSNDVDEEVFDFPVNGVLAPSTTPLTPDISVALEGVGPLTSGQPDIIDFGAVAEGEAAPTRRFIIRNDGAAPLDLSNVVLPAGFAIAEPLAPILGPGGFDGFTVRLNSAAPGDWAGMIRILSTDPDENPFDISVHGIVIATAPPPVPEITLLLDGQELALGQTIDFGSHGLGSANPERVLAIRNDGAAPLSVGDIALPAGYLLVQGPANSTLSPGASESIRVALNTLAAGTFAGAASIANTDSDESAFALAFTGVVEAPAVPAPISVSNVTSTFPTASIAGDRKARGTVRFTLTNIGVANISAPTTLTISASTSTPLITVTKSIKLKAGATKTIKVKAALPPTLAEGEHPLVVAATTNGLTSFASGPAIEVRAPFVRLNGLAASIPFGKPLVFGKRAMLSVPLQNVGNVMTTTSPVTYTVMISTDGTPAGRLYQLTSGGSIKLKPGASKPQKVAVTIPAGAVAAGAYTLIVRLNAELNETNGQPIATIPFAIA